MKYEIQGQAPNRQYLQIRAEIFVDEEEIELQFPTWRPGRYELGNFAKNVRSFAVFDEQGAPLDFKKIDTHVWKVEGISTEKIFVDYEYYASELNAGSSFLNDEMLYVNPVNCLIYVKGRENEACTLKIEVEESFQYAGTLPLNGGFISAESYHELVDSPFVFCKQLASLIYENKGVEFKVSFIGLDEIPWDIVLRDFQKFTEAQFDDFGHFPSKTFHFINIITPFPHYHGVEHKASTMIVLGPSYKIFNVYYDELLGISSHELYHVWNVKSIRSVDLFPYDYSRENLSKMGYLCEGITTYMGDYYLMKSGIWSPEKYLSEFEQVIQKHIDNFGRFNSSLAESSYDTWLDGYVPGAPARKTSIYNEGAIFAFVTDVFIRHETLGKKSIKDVMRLFYERYFLENKALTDDDFIAAVVEVSGSVEYKSIFQEMIYQRISFESHINAALKKLGFELLFRKNPDPVASRLGLKIIYEQGQARIQAIYPNSSSEASGLMIGDKILAVNQHIVQNDLEQWIAHFQSKALNFLVNRQGRVVSVNVMNSEADFFKLARIQRVENPSALSKSLYEDWTGLMLSLE